MKENILITTGGSGGHVGPAQTFPRVLPSTRHPPRVCLRFEGLWRLQLHGRQSRFETHRLQRWGSFVEPALGRRHLPIPHSWARKRGRVPTGPRASY